MTDIEQKALALVNEVQADWNYQLGSLAFNRDRDAFCEALCRAIEQHEAFRQEVSDAVEAALVGLEDDGHTKAVAIASLELHQFIIPASKPDPLVDIMERLDGEWTPEEYAKEILAALDARNLKIVKVKNDD